MKQQRLTGGHTKRERRREECFPEGGERREWPGIEPGSPAQHFSAQLLETRPGHEDETLNRQSGIKLKLELVAE